MSSGVAREGALNLKMKFWKITLKNVSESPFFEICTPDPTTSLRHVLLRDMKVSCKNVKDLVDEHVELESIDQCLVWPFNSKARFVPFLTYRFLFEPNETC